MNICKSILRLNKYYLKFFSSNKFKILCIFHIFLKYRINFYLYNYTIQELFILKLTMNIYTFNFYTKKSKVII